MRLVGGISKLGRAVRGDRRHDGVLGSRHRRLVQKDPGPLEPRGSEMVARPDLDRRAERLERQEVRVQTPTTDKVAPRLGQLERPDYTLASNLGPQLAHGLDRAVRQELVARQQQAVANHLGHRQVVLE